MRSKLLGSEEERAVSPVIGVILMVAITVILAAVIAAFVLDMGDDLGGEAQSSAKVTFDNSSGELTVEVTAAGNADEWQVRGDYYDNTTGSGQWVQDGDYIELNSVGDTATLECADPSSDYSLNESPDDSGTVTVVASPEDDGSWTKIGSDEWTCGSP